MHSPKEIYEWLERIRFYIEDPKSDSKVQLMAYMQDLKTYICVFEQIKWERDVAIQQLHDLGYGLRQITKKDASEFLDCREDMTCYNEFFCECHDCEECSFHGTV